MVEILISLIDLMSSFCQNQYTKIAIAIYQEIFAIISIGLFPKM